MMSHEKNSSDDRSHQSRKISLFARKSFYDWDGNFHNFFIAKCVTALHFADVPRENILPIASALHTNSRQDKRALFVQPCYNFLFVHDFTPFKRDAPHCAPLDRDTIAMPVRFPYQRDVPPDVPRPTTAIATLSYCHRYDRL